MKVPAALVSVLAAITCVQCATVPHGFIRNKTLGVAYKIMYQSKSWPDAIEACEQEGAQIAVPRSAEEFDFMQKLVRGMSHPNITNSEYKLVVWLGISNLDDYRTWKTVYGDNIEEVGFHRWARGNGESFSDAPEEPHCAGLDAMNPGLREFWCHRRQPFLCEINI
ncbi:hemolymph lipopolysaccharide-binding protein-like [Aricia agestis]|uniref:hemolymph lipopolysaccharide-binding protein-like n=1 Tax=Aricia agestis TaxID=91739 RepID=UPI001C209840|nr:hemolymph lipopolysaccharide-binding protein-like [Aricia agestis]